jgi:Major Facilitator Superfamily/PGF-CTERM motif
VLPLAFLRNDAINRVNIHTGIQALAQGAGGIFFLIFLIRGGVPVPAALTAQAAIFAGRFVIRPAILPLSKRWGLKPLVVIGALGLALQYPLLAEIDGIGVKLFALCSVAAIAEIFYWPAYNAYFAALGDSEHRGHQVSAREAIVAIVSIVAPLLGTWALVTLGPRPAFAVVGIVQALAALPLIGVPNVRVAKSAPGAFRAAWLGGLLAATDGWFDGWYLLVWQIALYLTLGESVSAYGGAMALAALVGAGFGLFLGRHVDAGHGRRAVIFAFGVTGVAVVLRAASLSSPWLAIGANALGAIVFPLFLPVLSTAVYNLAKASPCPMRFSIATEAGWDIGCTSACLIAAALFAAGVPPGFGMLLALPALLGAALLLRRYFAEAPAAQPLML